ncbi:hypothetical protein ACRN9Z_02510 [Shewanella frigidimarina]|jgi:hypothetical protein|uniref:Transmembrane anchor protein n=1 Tax=Shewanella frigidimarina (strain NCIMB 400) TaxID=318167 RepID=Q080F2_SHEFN|nr:MULTISPECIES: hypothetical protein [Shewanella]ABI72363.1 conserved hypothetical protein [Shewanella frigidimarina NCIMB 400]MBB1364196.1 hypothetical protein [Shewanella sp. SR44-4]MBB1427046.1 hypothetical protein [Shewanella sp. SG44-2]MBO1896760.1 hypothetical protein [Shewanella sp. BF02_Schw]PKH29355.1 hypothetical protein CXF88_17635 [Shewanella sp. ALD9]|tara:strand:- start:1470 stop:1991 length:522 start_codon:yes stop_codon:yes gene_type:complete
MQHTVSSSTLIKAALSAIVVAGIVLVTLILPAEYNIDPTGIGQKIGVTVLAQAAEPEVQQSAPAEGSNEFQTIEVMVPAGRGIEYKFDMQQFEKMTYEWITDGTALFVDLHGEPKGDTSGYYESYVIATSADMKGSFTAPFAGSHGWYWKNKSNQPVAVQLLVKGQYKVIGLK